MVAAYDDNDNDRNDEGEVGNPPIPNDAAAGGGSSGDNDNKAQMTM